MATRITRRLEFDAGHRIPDHQSQCRHLHGHRYAIEITLCGEVIQQAGEPVNGMVMDFSAVKELAGKHLVDAWDHAFLVYRGDLPVVRFLESLPNHKTVILDCVPTAENLAQTAFTILYPIYCDRYGNKLRLERIRLYETPNCWADATRDEVFPQASPGRRPATTVGKDADREPTTASVTGQHAVGDEHAGQGLSGPEAPYRLGRTCHELGKPT